MNAISAMPIAGAERRSTAPAASAMPAANSM